MAQPQKYTENRKQDRGQKAAVRGRKLLCVCVHTHSSIMAFLDVSQVITVNQASFQDL